MLKKITAIIVAIICVVCVALPILNTTTDNDKTLDVVVLAGQSQGAYMSACCKPSVVNQEIPQPATNCFYFGNSTRQIDNTLSVDDCDIYNMCENGQWKIGGLEPSIAYEISKITNHDVIVLNTNIGGKGVEYFAPSKEGGIWIHSVITTSLSLVDPSYKINKIAWVWAQGEHDSAMTVDNYITNFTVVNNEFKGMGFADCYIIQTRAENGGNSTIAQERIVDTFNNVRWGSVASQGFTQENGMLCIDDLHYTQSGRNVVGTETGIAIGNAQPVTAQSPLVRVVLSMIPLLIVVGLVIFIAGEVLLKNKF